MNFRTTYVLLGLVVVALAVLAGIVLFSDDDKNPVTTEGYLVKALKAANTKPEEVIAVEVERPGQTPDKYAFARTDKGWAITAPNKARADGPTIDALVSGILNARTEKSADIGSNATHGLESPPVKVTLRTKDVTETVSLGNVTLGGDQALVYVTTTDRPDKPQAVRKSAFRGLFKEKPPESATNAGPLVKDLREFRPLQMIGAGVNDPSQIISLAVRGSGDDQIALHRDPDGRWVFREPKGFGEANAESDAPAIDPKEPKVQIDSVRKLINTMAEVRSREYDQIIEKPESLAKYGLDPNKNKPMQLDLVRADGTQESLFVGDEVKDDKKDRYYARPEGDTIVAEVNATAVRDLQRVLRAKHLLRDRTVLKINPSRVDAIDILTNGDTISLRNVGGQWQLFDSSGNGRPARKQAVDELLNRLTARQLATGFPAAETPASKKGFEKPTAEVKLWEAGIRKDEKADPKAAPKVAETPTAIIRFGFKDAGNVVYTQRVVGKAESDYYVPQDLADLAGRNRLTYIAASLKQFTADKVRKLSFTHGKDAIELERPDDDKPPAQAEWKINGPESMKGRPADPLKVADLVNQLSFLTLQQPKVAAEKPADDVLNRLEFNPPRLTVTATLKEEKGTSDITYLFGGDVGTDKRQVYLKPKDSDLVFEVERGVFDLYQKADVQDTVVHKIDKTKIKAVKLTGWADVLGKEATIEFERKDGKWALKDGTFELDPVKVDLFLNDLTTPRAESFLALKTGPKPEHNLDVAKGALTVVLALEAGDPLTMTLSPPSKDGKVVATSSRSPGDVFTMADRFAAIRAKPAAFKKD
jgi:hypothetical protein